MLFFDAAAALRISIAFAISLVADLCRRHAATLLMMPLRCCYSADVYYAPRCRESRDAATPRLYAMLPRYAAKMPYYDAAIIATLARWRR